MAEANEIPTEWYFITAPQNVSWSKAGQSNQVQTYATNNPYLHYGSTGLRQLTLGNSMAEGFTLQGAVEQNIIALEACMRVVLETDDGYAAPFCWEVYAGGKMYGTYVIDNVSVQEQMRDNAGLAARANVDVSLKEVSPYQVGSGIDITAEALTGNLSEETQKQLLEKQQNQANNQDKAAKDQNKANGKGDGDGSGSGSSGGDGGPDKVTDKNYDGSQVKFE